MLICVNLLLAIYKINNPWYNVSMDECKQDELQQEIYNDVLDAWECIYQSGVDLENWFIRRALADLQSAMKRHENSPLVEARKLALKGKS